MWLQIVSAVTAALDELPKEEELKEKAASSTAEEKFSSLAFFSHFFGEKSEQNSEHFGGNAVLVGICWSD